MATIVLAAVFMLGLVSGIVHGVTGIGSGQPYCEYEGGGECDSLYQQRFAQQPNDNGGGANFTADEQVQLDYPSLSDAQFAANMRELHNVRQEMITKGDMLSATLVDLQRDAWITERKVAELKRFKYEESFNDRRIQ